MNSYLGNDGTNRVSSSVRRFPERVVSYACRHTEPLGGIDCAAGIITFFYLDPPAVWFLLKEYQWEGQ